MALVRWTPMGKLASFQDEMNRVFILRSFLADMPSEEAIAFLLQRMRPTRSNREFFQAMAEG